MKLLRTLDRWIAAGVGGLLVLAFGTMLVLAFLQVFLRIFFHTGIVWGDVAARYLVIWVGFFGAYLAVPDKGHFHIDALVRLFPARVRRFTSAVTNLFAAVICSFLLKASVTFLTIGIDPAASSFLKIPEHYIAMIVPVGFGLVGFRFLVRMIEDLAGDER